ncbi:carbamoyltransferase HypF [Oricola indica]|jgi:hydrogenase maturation protein HypF|uniref:carbamoyltransferase HypF n=1 Tax=Oricola indica TaxID=2872591 RepID=UPI001CBFD2A5|nr:carbamoyltransferase HypF [Oricola indica]
MTGERLVIRGQVQGVGFRPAVWRLARELGLAGDVRNTGDGVEIRLWGEGRAVFVERLRAELPALAEIEALERTPISGPAPAGFDILSSASGRMRSSVTPDAATCPDCLEEIRDPRAHRFRYPFTNCTNCGPRFSIVRGAPYDRARTTMRDFSMCETCAAEYGDPADRRFHAQPIACAVCGPEVWIERLGDHAVPGERLETEDALGAACDAILEGRIVAVKGIGGFHLACDATRADVVALLRERKRRKSRAFAMMARDPDVIRRHAHVGAEEEALLMSPAAPVVLLRARGGTLPDAVAPGLDRLGFMLPHTPMHHLMLQEMDRPVVMTSGNISGEPQCTANDDARKRLAGVAGLALMHNRDIANRIDDSVAVVVAGKPRMLRRARGYAPKPIALPDGFDDTVQVLALGSELKNTFCLIKDGQAVVSQHMGDLENAAVHADVEHNLALYGDLYEHTPTVFAVDSHPDYLSTKRGHAMAGDGQVIEVQHHHAHIAACMAENGLPLDAGAVLGIAMDGLGLGDDGTMWGGEFLACTYRGHERLASLKPVALPGGTAAVREPWRNLYAQIMAGMGWAAFAGQFARLDVFATLDAKPRDTLDAMIRTGTNSPLSSSCGRLFDAAAALVGLCPERQDYEGQAAILFEAALDPAAMDEEAGYAYPFAIAPRGEKGLPQIDPAAVWRAMLGDLASGTPVGIISARFHRGLAKAIIAMAKQLATGTEIGTVALSGGCFQNAILLTLVEDGLKDAGLHVISHSKVPANDGGLSLGQAAVAVAMLSEQEKAHVPRNSRTDR